MEKKRQRDLLEGDEKIKKVAKLCEGHMERKVNIQDRNSLLKRIYNYESSRLAVLLLVNLKTKLRAEE